MGPGTNAEIQNNNMRYQIEDLIVNFDQQDVIQVAYKVNDVTENLVIIENVLRQENPDTFVIPKQFMDAVIQAGVFDVSQSRSY